MSKKNPWQDSSPKEEELVDMYVMADRYVPRFASGVRSKINDAAVVYGEVVKDSLEQYYLAAAAFAGLASDPRLNDVWAPLSVVVKGLITDIVTESHDQEIGDLRRILMKQTPQEVLDYATIRSAELVTAINEGQREAIRTIIADGVSAGEAPRVVAKRVKNLGVGLTERGPYTYGRLARYRQAQIDAGVKMPLVEQRAARFHEKLLKERAESIARTEMIAAQNRGVLNAWNTGIRDGLVSQGAKKQWFAGMIRTCPICDGLDADGPVPINEPFGNGEMSPPAHPRCRCTMGLVMG